MSDCVEGQTVVSRKDVFAKYLQYYDKVSSEGNLKVCSETQVTDEGRRVLLLPEDEPRKRLNTLDFYETMCNCVRHRECQRRVHELRRAVEVLEMFCVNLFLFPWKKEIRTLKTFTGHFVYYIKPVLPFARNVLQTIGYSMDTDTEYRLSESFDPDKAKNMGFDLFLARLQCEYLLELLNQRSQLECLEILRTRAASWIFSSGKEVAEPNSDSSNLNEDVFENNECVEGGSVLNPGEQQQQKSLKSLNSHNEEVDKAQDGMISDAERSSNSFTLEDKSILEMQENYPDLAFRQKPIFRKSQRSMQPLKTQERPGGRGHSPGLFPEVSADMSGPQSIAICNETIPAQRNIHHQKALVECKPLDAKPLVLKVGALLQRRSREDSADDCLADLTEEVSVDEPLKYPIEETTQGQSDITTPTTKSPGALGLSILCSPSQEPVCNIMGCGSCSGDGVLPQDSTIKEPPQSIYIPTELSACTPGFGSPTDHSQTTIECSSPRKSPTSKQPEDDLDETYVLI